MRLLPHPHQLRASGTGYFSPLQRPDAPTPSAAAMPSRLSAGAEEYRPTSLSHLSEALTQEEVRARLLRGSTEQYLVMSPVSSAHVVGLLAEGDATVRRRVIACVRPIVHRVMTNRYPVFLALLHACNGRVNELKDIIGAMCNGKGFLMQFDGKEDHKTKQRFLCLISCTVALKELIRVVAWNRPLCKTLVHGLLRKERLMVEREGLAVLRHCFTMLPYEDCSMIFKDTLGAIDEILSSQFGWRCVAVCLENARNGELKDLEATILTRTSAFAKGRWSSYFLQHVLRYGSEQFKARIVERVAKDIVELSVDKFGCYVVEDCFLSTGSLAGLQRVLDAFLDLHDDDLAVAVKGWYSNYAIQKLLAAGKDHLPVRATELARRIEALPEVVRKHEFAKLVMEIINKLFPAQPIQ
ncbi:hypothetical protein SETIT_9G508100v2 [Setaria italica]|uniref:PUM-HD domain-containing protein n=1 Tax=Setaria italica TaxID=4555 RepID=A0A368SUT0_SETIT|nr:hypothetical protein SETIT_9G508100v2 [Setaria italica]